MSTVSVQYLQEQIDALKRRLDILEQRPSIPFLSTYRCIKCGHSYQGRGVIACGAMPLCPHCGSTQSSWEHRS
jgi:rubrerythrin